MKTMPNVSPNDFTKNTPRSALMTLKIWADLHPGIDQKDLEALADLMMSAYSMGVYEAQNQIFHERASS